ncbi:hypothetical protein TNCV_2389831 [Trichonephila clavipes]|nr:hypothetical protein TNCV_2389831 [Trichonephila clavipes]
MTNSVIEMQLDSMYEQITAGSSHKFGTSLQRSNIAKLSVVKQRHSLDVAKLLFQLQSGALFKCLSKKAVNHTQSRDKSPAPELYSNKTISVRAKILRVKRRIKIFKEKLISKNEADLGEKKAFGLCVMSALVGGQRRQRSTQGRGCILLQREKFNGKWEILRFLIELWWIGNFRMKEKTVKGFNGQILPCDVVEEWRNHKR